MMKKKEIKIELVNQPNSQLLPVWIGQKVLSKLKTLTTRLTGKSGDISAEQSKSIGREEGI